MDKFVVKKGTLSGNGAFYKGNLHCHSTNSDGKLSVDELVTMYRKQGYHFLCFSEHDLYTDYRTEYCDENFILLPGLEASAILLDENNPKIRKKVHHIHGILGTQEMQKKSEIQGLNHMEFLKPRVFSGTWEGAKVCQDLINDLIGRGYVTIYNHPIWSRVRTEEFIYSEGLCGIEIFNYNTVNESGTGYDINSYDQMLRDGKQIFGFASDDNHNEGQFPDSFGGFIMVKALELSHDEIMKSIMNGNFYASSGPVIHSWDYKDAIVQVECSPVERINFIVGNYVNAGMTCMAENEKDSITSAQYRLTGMESYIRAECIDHNGKTAWTNSIFFL